MNHLISKITENNEIAQQHFQEFKLIVLSDRQSQIQLCRIYKDQTDKYFSSSTLNSILRILHLKIWRSFVKSA